jgi:hypothetical protein
VYEDADAGISNEEYASRENIELIDMGERIGNVEGLTMQENNELRGVLYPGEESNLESRVGPDGALQIQADYFNKLADETAELMSNIDTVE